MLFCNKCFEFNTSLKMNFRTFVLELQEFVYNAVGALYGWIVFSKIAMFFDKRLRGMKKAISILWSETVSTG